jgi:hypothetical protein
MKLSILMRISYRFPPFELQNVGVQYKQIEGRLLKVLGLLECSGKVF